AGVEGERHRRTPDPRRDRQRHRASARGRRRARSSARRDRGRAGGCRRGGDAAARCRRRLIRQGEGPTPPPLRPDRFYSLPANVGTTACPITRETAPSPTAPDLREPPMSAVRNIAREKLEQGQLALGVGIRMTRSVEIAKGMAVAGFDWLFLDMEHGVMSLEACAQI